MPRPRAVRSLLPILAATVALLALPAVAPAATVHTFVNTTDLTPSGNANATVGPANEYPATIEVEDVPGTVTKVTAEVVDLSSGKPEDIDMALENPDGEVTMLMSDACGTTSLVNDDWTFDDSAQDFVPPSSCASGQTARFAPSDYGNPAADDLSVEGGPEGPYGEELAELAGGEPDGEWNLYVLDDNIETVGFGTGAWVLRLEVEPPPGPPTPAPLVVTAPVVTAAAPPAPPPAPAAAANTGKRAKALARCKAKKTHKARQACKKKARKLPL